MKVRYSAQRLPIPQADGLDPLQDGVDRGAPTPTSRSVPDPVGEELVELVRGSRRGPVVWTGPPATPPWSAVRTR